jgi:uncharacterized protein
MIRLRIAPELRLFLAARHREGEILVGHDGTATIGHLVQAAGPPLTEVGALIVAGCAMPETYRPRPGDEVDVHPMPRPQPLPTSPARFVLDVHLGALARRLRLLGLDTDYRPRADDADLLARSQAERRMLLTQDRGLLRQRAARHAAYVHGAHPDHQLRDVLGRFAPQLAPWTRCPACNGPLAPVAKREIETRLEPGTRRSYDTFARCEACARLYWRGAHDARLAPLVAEAERLVDMARERTAGTIV